MNRDGVPLNFYEGGGGLKKISMRVREWGLKTETGNFLLHFQNSKSRNRCRSIYGIDINSSKWHHKSKGTFSCRIIFGKISFLFANLYNIFNR